MARLSELIRAANIAKLSKRSDVPADRLQALATGAEATLGELRRVATALRVGLDELVPPSHKAEGAHLLFRGASPAGEHLVVTERLARKIGYSLDILRKPEPYQWLAVFPSLTDESYSEAEAAATRFRLLFYADDQVSPLFDLPQVLANALGVVVFVINTSEIDGASAYFEGIPFIFVSSRFPPRMLFTVAHELGHLVANRNEQRGFAVIDSDTNSALRGSSWTTQERFAHAFASCLLMPKSSVGIVLKKVRDIASVGEAPLGDIELLYLSRIFGVSFEAAARRCEDLKLLPVGGAASLNDELKRRFGSAEKRAEAVELPPRPEIRFSQVPDHLLRAAVERVKAGELSAGKAAAILGISIADLVSANASTTH
jgi:Zn-dependent peptidase ImmA (M78 family)